MRSEGSNVIKVVVALGLIFGLIAMFYIFVNKTEGTKDSTLKITESANTSSFNKYKDSDVKGSNVIKTVQFESNQRLAIVVDNSKTVTKYGNVANVKDEVSNACGYESYTGTLGTKTNTYFSPITNKSSKEFINSSSDYSAKHICDSSKNVIGVYFKIIP